MTVETRTSKSLINAKVNLIYFILQTIVSFWSRKIFYEYLGSEILGLDTTANSILQFLNIAESGVGVAIAYFLYAPLYKMDTIKINQIVTLQGWIYRRIASLILIFAVILMCFFPLIFKNIQTPLWYAYAIFIVLLVGNLIGYYINYRQCVLAADQKMYKITRVSKFTSIFFQVLLIALLPHVSNPFLLYIITTLLGYVIGSIWLCKVLKIEYPWLKSTKESGGELIRIYPDILKKTKQLFIHKIAGFVVFYCSPLIMYAFSNLSLVAYYGNYIAVTGNVSRLINQVFSSTGAAVGNLIASGNTKRVISVFWELSDSRMCFSSIVLTGIFCVIDPFISLWLSPDYILSRELKVLIIAQSWLTLNRSVIDSYKDGLGLFQDVWAPLIEGIINISISVISGYILGIEGVLLGGIISHVVIVYGWKPFYLFRRGLEINPFRNFFIPFIFRSCLSIILSYIIIIICDNINYKVTVITDLIIYSLIIFTLSSIVFYLIFSLFTDGMRSFNSRIFEIVKDKYLD